ncbi:MAG TPA: O-antigen ligase family protein [Pirellulales bacterium]
MIATIVFWLATQPAIPVGNRLHRYFAFFIVVLVVSWILSPYQAEGEATVENYLKYATFYVLLVTSVRTDQDLRNIIVGHFAVVTLVMAHTLRENFNGNAWYAQGIVRMQGIGQTFRDPNDLAGLIVCSQPFAWVLWSGWRKRWQRVLLLGHFGMAGYCVMLTGSRMGMVGILLAGLLASVASPKRLRLLAAYTVILAAVWMLLPEDRKSRYLSLYDSSYGNSATNNSGSRLRVAGFEAAIPVFLQKPLLGFGPSSFSQASGTGHLPHNLYGQLLAELGVAGAVTFGLMLFGVLQNTLEARMLRGTGCVDEFAWRTVIAASASFLLLAVMAWGFNFLFWHVWLWFGAFQVVGLRLMRNQVEYWQMCQEGDFLNNTEDVTLAWE